MEILHPHRILFSIYFFLLNLPSSLQDEYYYINCGSTSSIPSAGRTFVGDANSSSFTLSSSQSSTVRNPNSSTDSTSLYDTARIFRRQSSYQFDIVENGTYMVRLHFFAFTSQDNLFDAKFNVSASGFSLLSNFGVKNSTSNSPLVEEFLLTIHQGNFKIDFIPSGSSSVAFINAIEALLTPTSPRLLIPDSAPRITSLGNTNSQYNGLLSNLLHVIHRINVGGDAVTPENDTLPRNWVPDDNYLLLPEAAMNSTPARPNYQGQWASEYDAPKPVYETAKVMNTSYASSVFNISWRFNVSKNDRFLVRAHFCDVVSQPSSTIIQFNLYLYSNFSKLIVPREDARADTVVPFYEDFVIDSDDSGFMNISIGPQQDSSNQTAFLNGLEIMKVISDADSIPNGSGGTKKKSSFIIGSTVGGTVFVIISLVMFLFVLKRRKAKSDKTFQVPLPQFSWGSSPGRTTQRNDYGSPIPDLNLGLKLPLADILFATNSFDVSLIVGEGGFGKVYKGTLSNGTKVAVKRSEPGRRQGLPEFQTEITVLSKIRHRHLVSLIGYCDERSEMILVYEFMEKGTLREHLYNSKGQSRRPSTQGGLSWEKRLQLCIDAAKGLNYLHAGLNWAIIHRDIKSTNILLDEHYVAKVADFGISRSGPLDQSHISTEVKGSFGYLDPEYFKRFQLTQKSDVYSFGVVLLEVLCARAAIDNSLPVDQVNLAEWGLSCITGEGEIEKIIDPLLVGKIKPASLRKFGETVEKCLQEYGVDRPNMVDVLWDLEYALQLQHTAVPRQAHEDSTTDVSCDLPLPVILRLPSHSLPINEDEELPLNVYSDTSCTTASQVFSQLRIDEAR